MLKVTHGVGIGRIRKQDVAVWRAAGHRAKIECHRIRAAAVLDVAGVNDKAPLAQAIVRLPRPQNGSQTAVTPFSSGSCSNSGANAIGGVSN